MLFNIWAQWLERSYHGIALTFSCRVLLFRLIEHPAPVTHSCPLIQIIVIWLLKEESSQFICRRNGIDNVWSVQVRKDQHKRFHQLRTQRNKGIENLSRSVRITQFFYLSNMFIEWLSDTWKHFCESSAHSTIHPITILFVCCLSKRRPSWLHWRFPRQQLSGQAWIHGQDIQFYNERTDAWKDPEPLQLCRVVSAPRRCSWHVGK